ncbi:MAG: hypothetical protein H7320_14380 [Ferruginibacter sp.]|nr:hypothetical protein [Ferruginibacter sp.]
MNKLLLLRRSSIIHAIKCSKATANAQAIASFDRLIELKIQIVDTSEDQLDEISEKVNSWAGSNPIATEKDIQELFKK